MAGGFRCSHGHTWTPPAAGPLPRACPVCGDTVVMAADPTAEAVPHRQAFVLAVPPDHPDPAGKDATLPPGPYAAATVEAARADSPTVTLPPMPLAALAAGRDAPSFSSLVGMPGGETVAPGADHGSVVPFGDRTMDYTPPPVVPGYEILHEVGRGGMGVVYKARQISLNRTVALKMILAGSHAGPTERDRFRREAEAVATLQNPHIVQIFEIGEANGHLYLALEFVEGGSLAQHLRGSTWPGKEAAELVELLARAVHYAHGQGVVHRDLKPANILLGAKFEARNPKSEKEDIQGLISHFEFRASNYQPKVSDFGLAKRLGDTANPDGTKTGAVMGTPSYIAPEQASGKTRDVGPAADVYSLGAILYELLTGRPPFMGETPLDTVLQVLHDDPVTPKRLQPTVPKDLETICLMCLNKSAAKRYASADALAEDLRRFRTGEPIKARPLSAWGRGVKWAQRHPSLAALGAVTVTAAVALIGTLTVAYARVRDAVEEKQREAEVARKARADEEEQRKRAEQLAIDNEAKRKDAAKQNEELKRQIEERHRAAFALQLAQVAAMCDRDPRRALALLEDNERCPPELRDFTWAYLRRLCQREEQIYADHQAAGNQPAEPLHAVAFSPVGNLVATAGARGPVRIWDPRDGRTWAVLVGHDRAVRGVAFSPDGGAVAAAGEDGAICLWELPVEMLDDTRKSVAFLPVIRPWVKPLTLAPAVTLAGAHRGSRVNCVAFSPDGRLLVSGGDDGSLRWWGLGGWRAANADVSGGGSAAAAAGLTQARRSPHAVWLVADVEQAHVRDDQIRGVKCVVFAASGRVLVSGGADHTARVWEPRGEYLIRIITGHADAVAAVAVSPDGRTVATANNHATTPTIRLVNADTGRDIRRLTGHTRAVYALAFSADGELVASAGLDKSIRLWDLDGQERALLLGHGLAVSGLAFAPDRRTLVSAGMDATARVWQTTARAHDSGQIGRDVSLAAAAVSAGRGAADAAPTATTFVAGDERGRVQVYRSDLFPNRARGGPFFLAPVPVNSPPQGPIRATAASPDGSVVLASTNDAIFVWRMRAPVSRTGMPLPLTRPVRMQVPKPVYAMAVDPSGRWLATLDQEGVRVWNLHALPAAMDRTDRAVEPQGPGLILRVHDARELAFHPAGDKLALAVENGVRVIDRNTGRVLANHPAAHDSHVEAVAFGGDDGRLLATADANGLVKVWRVGKAGDLVFQTDLTGHTAAVYALAFSPDGRTLASGGHDRTILLWDPQSGQERAVLTGHSDRVLRLQFLPDASALISVARDGGVKR